MNILRESAAENNYPLLEVIGSNEFLPDYQGLDEPPRLTAQAAQKSFKAYQFLAPNLVYTSSKTVDWFKKYAYKIPKTFVEVQGKPSFARLKIPGSILNIGFILCPPGLAPDGSPTLEQINDIKELAAEKKAGASLLALITPWGFYPEHLAIEGWIKDAELFDLVLGGGEGSALATSVNPKNKALAWARSDHKGYGITVVDFFDFPTPKSSGTVWEWKIGKNIQGTLVPLKAYTPSDPDMEKIVGTPPPQKTPAPPKKVEVKKVEVKKVEPKKIEPTKVEPRKIEPKKITP